MSNQSEVTLLENLILNKEQYQHWLQIKTIPTLNKSMYQIVYLF